MLSLMPSPGKIHHEESKHYASIIKPFLRWAGGKSLFVRKIISFFPAQRDINTYYEPFLGAGSVFLAYKPEKAVLSDLNEQLIRTFSSIKSNPRLVHLSLRQLGAKDSKVHFYRVRAIYNRSRDSFRQAARFIYLNKACFNGIFRVNTVGAFNVPYGFKKQLAFPALNQFIEISKQLKKAKLYAKDYRVTLKDAKEGDLVYLDPPYPPINGSSYFTHYTKERFSTKDQLTVAQVANELSLKGCYVVVTNAHTEQVLTLYNGWNINIIERPRWITCQKTKHKVRELIITNFK